MRRPAFDALAGEAVDPVVRPSARADAQVNGALALGRRLGREPRQVAEQVVAACAGALEPVARAEVAGPGFVNITFTDAFLSTQLMAVSGAGLGVWPADLPEMVRNGRVLTGRHPLAQPVLSVDEAEREAILRAGWACDGRVTEMARLLGIGRSTLWRKMRQFDISPTIFKN